MYSDPLNEWYLEELCDALRQVLVALDVELQLVESGRQWGGTTALVTPAQRNRNTELTDTSQAWTSK